MLNSLKLIERYIRNCTESADVASEGDAWNVYVVARESKAPQLLTSFEVHN